MADPESELKERYRESIAKLVHALERGEGPAFAAALDELVYLRQPDLFTDLRKLADALHGALERFGTDPRLVDLARKDVPDARQRLNHVLKLTDEAAHTTLDLVERSGPLADRLAKGAAALAEDVAKVRAKMIRRDVDALIPKVEEYLAGARKDSDAVRGHLAEVLLAQGYQDLTGQIIRGVVKLVDEVETALADLVKLSTGEGTTGGRPPRARVHEATTDEGGHGPAVPGVDNGGVVVNGQSDVDDLLSSLNL